MGIIAKPFGQLLKFLYDFCGKNYGFAIIIFTIIVNLILVIFTYKQQKSMIGMQKIQPKLNELQKKYANNKEKLNIEMMKLYKENDVNPAGGCLPLLIQFPVIIALYQVVTRPLTYMYNLTADQIKKLSELAGIAAEKVSNVAEIETAQKITAEIIEKAGLTATGVEQMNFNFLGLNFGDVPMDTWGKGLSLIWIVPVLCALTTYVSTKISMKMQNTNTNAEENPAAGTMNTMNTIMPFMTGYFAAIVPGAVGLYWILGNIIRTSLQVVITNKLRKEEEEKSGIITVEHPVQKKKKKK